MQGKLFRWKSAVVRWRRFTRRSDAAFLSLGREICIGRLTVATLLCATAPQATAQVSVVHRGEKEAAEVSVDEVEVTASRVAMPMSQTARIVSVMTREQIEDCPAQSVNDLLKYVASVDVRQRGVFGVQTDISINGGTHDQIVILLNGVNISSPHTGHLAADLPVNISDIERIEVLEGAASRVYGTSAFSGAVNIVTKSGHSHLSLPAREGSSYQALHGTASLCDGSFGTVGMEGGMETGVAGNLSAGFDRSDGGTPNSDFVKARGFWHGSLTAGEGSEAVAVDWQAGMSRMDYGANTFYSGRFPDQYEENRRWMASVSARTQGRWQFAPTLYWNRAYDHFQLTRGSGVGENFHRTDVYGANLNGRTTWRLGTTAVGCELRNEGILSTTLGKPLDSSEWVGIPGHDGHYTRSDNRTNMCCFFEHDVVAGSWTVSAGAMANMNTWLDHRWRLYPGVDVSYRPSPSWRLYASWNTAQRMPTFTELYYRSPTQEGNTGLRPERTRELTAGAHWRTTGLTADARFFIRHGKDMIDWVVTPADSVNGYTTFHAASFALDNTGCTLSATLHWRELLARDFPLRTFTLSYSYIHQHRHDSQPVIASNYALDYLRHKLVARLDAQLWRSLSATLAMRWQDRMGSYIHYAPSASAAGQTTWETTHRSYRPFALLDLRLQWTARRWEAFLEGNNLTSHRYVDLGNVSQPGFWFMAGTKWKW